MSGNVLVHFGAEHLRFQMRRSRCAVWLRHPDLRRAGHTRSRRKQNHKGEEHQMKLQTFLVLKVLQRVHDSQKGTSTDTSARLNHIT